MDHQVRSREHVSRRNTRRPNRSTEQAPSPSNENMTERQPMNEQKKPVRISYIVKDLPLY